MENYRELMKDTTVARLVFREIPYSGIGYVSMKGEAENRDLLLGMGVAQMHDAGAKTIYCGFKNDGLMKVPKLHGFLCWEQFYSHAHDMDSLQIDLSGIIHLQDAFELAFVPLRRDIAELYKRVYNESFCSIANAATCAHDSIEALLENSFATGELVLYRGEAAGVVETSADSESAVLEGIALLPQYRSLGLGRALLRRVLLRFVQRGFGKADLLVSSANPAAYRLYLSEGFEKKKLYARWFRLETDD